MKKETSNPFVLPGFGQTGEAAGNPVFAGMEMMRQAWQGMAGGGQMDPVAASMMSVEDLERRIAELQAVESWLRLNLSMLGNTIQAMEIQRSTLATLRAFATSGVPTDFSAGSSGQRAASEPRPEPTESRAESASGAESAQTDAQPYAQAAEDWWNMVQQQFQTLAAATAATLQGTPDAADAPTPGKAAPAAKAARKTARKRAAPAKTARKTTRTR